MSNKAKAVKSQRPDAAAILEDVAKLLDHCTKAMWEDGQKGVAKDLFDVRMQVEAIRKKTKMARNVEQLTKSLQRRIKDNGDKRK